MRYPDIDILRTVAIVLMTYFHWHYIDDVFKGTEKTSTPLLQHIGTSARSIFIFLVGFTMMTLHKSNDGDDEQENKLKEKQNYRGLKVFGFGLVMSLLTYLVVPNEFVRFGILHFIGVSILLLNQIIHNPIMIAVVAFITFGFHVLLQTSFLGKFSFLTGYTRFASVDHFPLFKWFWLVCIGALTSNFIYSKDKKYALINIEDKLGISKLGQYSLEYYVLHYIVLYFLKV